MKPRTIIIAALALIAAVAGLYTQLGSRTQTADAGVGLTTASSAAGSTASADAANPSKVVVYKSPTCGCCGDWIEHMRKSGFDVEVIEMADVTPIKVELRVGPSLRSCHTAKVGGYVLEGHVPAEQVVRMLAEKPEIRGLAVPGMPIGSPGMDAGYDRSTWQDYDVVAFGDKGPEVYVHIKNTL